MKKTKAYNLEIEAIEAIEQYRIEKDLKSASSALDKILLNELPKQLEYEDLKTELNELKELIRNLTVATPVQTNVLEPIEESSIIKNSYAKSFENMPD